MAREFPGVNRVKKRDRNGEIRYYFYHRPTGKRLHGEWGSIEFVLSYEAAEASLDQGYRSDTFNDLIRQYTTSPEFTIKLRQSTQIEYKRMLTSSEQKFGRMPIGVLEDRRIRSDFLAWREQVFASSGPREADNRLSIISAMLTWATDRSIISVNHLKGFKRLHRSDWSEIIWLDEHIDAFMKVAPIELQRALILALHSGQREGDILQLNWTAYDGETLKLRQSKSARGGRAAPLVTIPCTQTLRDMLDGMDHTTARIITTRTGKPFEKRHFCRLWKQTVLQAGLSQIAQPGVAEPRTPRFHDIRGTTVTILSVAGSSPQQIAAITGHSLRHVTSILERYLARPRTLAEEAISKWETSPAAAFANSLQTRKPHQATDRGNVS